MNMIEMRPPTQRDNSPPNPTNSSAGAGIHANSPAPWLARRFDYLARYGTLRHPHKGDGVWDKKRFYIMTGRRYRQACREWDRMRRQTWKAF